MLRGDKVGRQARMPGTEGCGLVEVYQFENPIYAPAPVNQKVRVGQLLLDMIDWPLKGGEEIH